MVMKKRVMRGSVTVIGPPRRIWSWKIGTTLPSDPSTLPNRTTVKQVDETCDMAWTKRSAICFGHAHDARGMDGLVGGDEDEVPHAELVGHFGHDLGAADVVADRLADVQFHQGHVLVRGGVENDLRMVLRERAAARGPRR